MDDKTLRREVLNHLCQCNFKTLQRLLNRHRIKLNDFVADGYLNYFYEVEIEISEDDDFTVAPLPNSASSSRSAFRSANSRVEISGSSANSIDWRQNVARSPDRLTLLHFAARGWRTSGAKPVSWLVEQGMDVNARDSLGRTPLHYAASSLQLDSLLFLLKDPRTKRNVQCRDGLTPLHCLFAARRGPRNAVGIYPLNLRDRVEGVRARTLRDMNLVISTNVEAQETLQQGILFPRLPPAEPWDLTLVDSFGRTPLHVAAGSWSRTVVESLVVNGNASIVAKDKRGNFPFHYALASLDLGTCQYLLPPVEYSRDILYLNSSLESLVSVSSFYRDFALENPIAGVPLLHAIFTQAIRSRYVGVVSLTRHLLEKLDYNPNLVCYRTGETVLELVCRTAMQQQELMVLLNFDVVEVVLALIQNGAHVFSPRRDRTMYKSNALHYALRAEDLFSGTLISFAGARIGLARVSVSVGERMVALHAHAREQCVVEERFGIKCLLCFTYYEPPSLMEFARRVIRKNMYSHRIRSAFSESTCISPRHILPPKLIDYLLLRDLKD